MGWGAILRGRVGAVYLCLISLGRGEAGPGEGLECSVWGIFWSRGDDGGCDGCTDDGRCTSMGGGGGESVGTMWELVGELGVGSDEEMGLGCRRLGVGRMLVVGGRLGGKRRRMGSPSVDRLRIITIRRRELIHLRVIRRILGGLPIVWIRRRLVVGRRRTAKDGLVRLIALVWLTWASWPLHRDWQWGVSLVVVVVVVGGRIKLAAIECVDASGDAFAWKTHDNIIACPVLELFPSAVRDDDKT